MSFAQRPPRAAALLAAYLVAQVVGPLLHVVGHRNDHVHGPGAARDVASLDPSTFLDASGRPNLEALARALEGSPDEPHEHSHDDSTPLDHARGASEHFASLLASSTPIPHSPVTRPLEALGHDGTHGFTTIVERARFLTSQRAQAPPA